MTLWIVLAYLGFVVLIGALSTRLARATGEDFFIASRTIGPFVLLMTLFGTHMTSFALLGASAEAYRVGVGVFALMASSSALMAPMVFFFVGTRVWALGRRHGYLTQVQLLRDRFQSEALGIGLFVVLVLLLVPYLLIGVMGGGITLHQLTGGEVPEWAGGLLIVGVVMLYVSSGGMRATAWVNTFQTSLFMVLGGVTAWVILRDLGGLEPAMRELAARQPDLLAPGAHLRPLQLLSYTLIPLSVGMFPHIFGHWLSARGLAAFRTPVVLYPLCLVVVWVPSVLLGVLGRLDFPDLQGPATNSVLIQSIAAHAPEVLAGLLGAGVFAAIMSSLDSQSLALGTLFSEDIARRYGLLGLRGADERRRVRVGRGFVLLVLTATYLLSLVTNRGIFGLAVWSFTGYSALLPILLAALFWRRATAVGALASLITTAVLWLLLFDRGFGRPDYSVGGTGLMPVAVVFGGSAIALVVGSLLSRPPDEAVLRKFFSKPPGAAG